MLKVVGIAVYVEKNQWMIQRRDKMVMKAVGYLSKNKSYNAWECQICSTITPIKKGLPAPECEYCRRVAEHVRKG
jgi:hypothetical protein